MTIDLSVATVIPEWARTAFAHPACVAGLWPAWGYYGKTAAGKLVCLDPISPADAPRAWLEQGTNDMSINTALIPGVKTIFDSGADANRALELRRVSGDHPEYTNVAMPGINFASGGGLSVIWLQYVENVDSGPGRFLGIGNAAATAPIMAVGVRGTGTSEYYAAIDSASAATYPWIEVETGAAGADVAVHCLSIDTLSGDLHYMVNTTNPAHVSRAAVSQGLASRFPALERLSLNGLFNGTGSTYGVAAGPAFVLGVPVAASYFDTIRSSIITNLAALPTTPITLT